MLQDCSKHGVHYYVVPWFICCVSDFILNLFVGSWVTIYASQTQGTLKNPSVHLVSVLSFRLLVFLSPFSLPPSRS